MGAARPSPGRPLGQDFASDVRLGLQQSQKMLPSKYLYDDVGTALFEAITALPEYGLTRADDRILRRCAPRIAERLGHLDGVAELGSGSGRKTRPLLAAFARQQALDYYAIDGSRKALEACERELQDLPRVRFHGFENGYLEGLSRVWRAVARRGPLLVLFLGGSIGNFDLEEVVAFLSAVRQLLRRGDFLLLGTDLEKEVGRLLVAYDDPAGVTACFNLNLLARINRELDGNFDLRRFRHEARWSTKERRIEMHLRSVGRQMVRIPRARCTVRFEDGESIWTESSQRFTVPGLERIASRAGFIPTGQWIDRTWLFAESLWAVL